MNGSDGDTGREGERNICPDGATKERGKCGEMTAVAAAVFDKNGDGPKMAAVLLRGKVSMGEDTVTRGISVPGRVDGAAVVAGALTLSLCDC